VWPTTLGRGRIHIEPHNHRLECAIGEHGPDRALDASPSLHEVARARAILADRLVTPWWYHPVLGLLVAQHALVQGLDNRNWTLPSALLLLAGCVALVVACRRVTGLSVTTPTGPRSRRLLALRVLVALACIWAAALASDLRVAAAAAVLVFVATVALGRRYDAALRDDLHDTGGRLA